MKPKGQLASLPQYDEMVMKDVKLPTVSSRPTVERGAYGRSVSRLDMFRMI